MRFENRIVAVTGAAKGIGRATADAFAREGARECAVVENRRVQRRILIRLDQRKRARMAFIVLDHDDCDGTAHAPLFRLLAGQLIGSVIVNVLPL